MVELYNGDVIPIVRRAAAPPNSPTIIRCPHVPPVVQTRQFLRVAEAASLPPLSETVVAVRADVEGLHLLESLDNLYNRKQVAMSNGLANLQRNIPVASKVANMSRKTVTFTKNERVGCAIPAPVNIVAVCRVNRGKVKLDALLPEGHTRAWQCKDVPLICQRLHVDLLDTGYPVG